MMPCVKELGQVAMLCGYANGKSFCIAGASPWMLPTGVITFFVSGPPRLVQVDQRQKIASNYFSFGQARSPARLYPTEAMKLAPVLM
jgi:hypothetical protein